MNKTKLFLAFILCILTIVVLNSIIGNKIGNNVSNNLDNNSILKNIDEDSFLAGIARVWVKPKVTESVLENYPFALENPPVSIIEGFEAYDGYLLDKPGDFHWAIDYVKNDNGNFLPFPVYSAHGGTAFQGYGKTWGKFVVVKIRDENGNGYNTLYSHLENVPTYLPYMNTDIDNSKGVEIKAKTYIGDAGKSGNTKGINQLHFELHKVSGEDKRTVRIDPYGLYLRFSSGKYLQPGTTLFGLEHYWMDNNPGFVE